jgi:hypothetical protein
MARQTKPLSVKEIESAKPKEADYVLYDGDGLELLIKSSGSKIWQFRYIRPVTKKRAKKSIGPYPSVTLADARNYRAESALFWRNKLIPGTSAGTTAQFN